MKRLLTSILVLAGAFSLCRALDDESGQILSKIEKASHGAMTVDFYQKSKSVSNAETTLEGKLQFKPDSYLNMTYTNGDFFLIDGSRMTIKNNGQQKVFDTSKNIMMRGLSHVLLYSFLGTPAKIGQEQTADVSARQEGNFFVVSITSRKKQARGYSCITIRYSVSDCSIHDMKMDEVTGASTYYSIKN